MIQYSKRELILLLKNLSDDDYVCFTSENGKELIINKITPYDTYDPFKVDRKGLELQFNEVK